MIYSLKEALNNNTKELNPEVLSVNSKVYQETESLLSPETKATFTNSNGALGHSKQPWRGEEGCGGGDWEASGGLS